MTSNLSASQTQGYFEDVLPYNECVYSAVSTRHGTLEGLKKLTNFKQMTYVEMNQVHGDTVTELPETHETTCVIPESDAVFTTARHTALIVRTADCLPILFYHPEGVIGAIHAGRKSTELGILRKTIRELQEKVEITALKKLTLWFGPCICTSCYEIDPISQTHYDLIAKNTAQLHMALPDSHFEVVLSNLCTKCQNDTFYSYREEGQNAGRFYSIIAKR